MAAQVVAPAGEDGVQLGAVEVERDEHGGVGAAVDVELGSRRRQARSSASARRSGGASTSALLARDQRTTALDALKAGFPVTVHVNATRAVELEEGDGERAAEELRRAGAMVEEEQGPRGRLGELTRSTRSSNMTSPSSVRWTGHLAAITAGARPARR